MARAHARGSDLDIDYVHGVAEALPADDNAFDAVVCCDVLEHVSDLDMTIREAARVLRLGGIYLYDTINHTTRSKLLVITLFQEWSATAFMPPNVHDHAMFIKPAGLNALLHSAGLEPGPIVGIAPGVTPPRAIALMRAVPADASPTASSDASCECASYATPRGFTPAAPPSRHHVRVHRGTDRRVRRRSPSDTASDSRPDRLA